jgi:hypothetical protein
MSQPVPPPMPPGWRPDNRIRCAVCNKLVRTRDAYMSRLRPDLAAMCKKCSEEAK